MPLATLLLSCSFSSSIPLVTVTLPPSAANQPNLWLGFYWENDGSVRNVPGFTIDNVVVTGDAIGVETTLNQNVTQTQNAGQNEQYISSSNKIIATVVNPNANLNCVTASVTQAGISATSITTATGSYLRSEKVIQVTPAAPNTTASYKLTLYYTTAELAIWAASAPTLKVMKVKDGVNLNSILTTANAALYTPVFDDQRVTKGYASYTIDATDGFSQFMLVSPTTTLPVLSLDFNARPEQNSIALNWSTTMEINNKGFGVERSIDGTNFENIGWVNGAGNSNSTRSYTYKDNFVQPNVVYYYRLRQVDVDNRPTISVIRQAKIKEGDVVITVSPNPAKDIVKLFIAGVSGKATVTMFNVEGQRVRSWNALNVASLQTLNVSGLAKGTYVIKVDVSGKTYNEKIVIQ